MGRYSRPKAWARYAELDPAQTETRYILDVRWSPRTPHRRNCGAVEAEQLANPNRKARVSERSLQQGSVAGSGTRRDRWNTIRTRKIRVKRKRIPIRFRCRIGRLRIRVFKDENHCYHTDQSDLMPGTTSSAQKPSWRSAWNVRHHSLSRLGWISAPSKT
jgi:hypothetical protein